VIERRTKSGKLLGRRNKASRSDRAARAIIEPLERRILFTWIGAVTGNTNNAAHHYNTAANWAGGIIDDSFAGVTFTGNTTLYFTANRTTGAAGLNLGYSGSFGLTFMSSNAATRTLTLAGNVSAGVANQTVTLGDVTNTDDLNVALGASPITFNTATGETLAVVNVISGANSLVGSGSGTLTLSGVNTFTGGATLSSGQLNVNNAKAVGTGTFTINGGTIDNTSGATITLSNNNAQTWGGDFTFLGSSALNLGTGAVALGANRTVTVSGSNLTEGGIISGAFSLTKAGAGTFTLSGANTFSNGMTLSAGQLNINNATAVGSGTLTINGGTIDNTNGVAITLSNNNAQTWGGDFTFVGSNALNLGTGAVTLGANRSVTVSASTLTEGGVIGDSGNVHSLTKAGAGILTLTGSDTYTGGTSISAGTLSFANGALSTGGITFAASSTLQWNGANAQDISGQIQAIATGVTATLDTQANNVTLGSSLGGMGGIAKVGTGALTISGANTYSGGTTLTAGTLNINSATAIGTGTFTINAGTINNTSGGAITLSDNNAEAWGASFTFTGTNALNLGTGAVTLGANITATVSASTLTDGGITSGAFSLTKAGAGALTLSGANTFSNGMTLTAGQLNINNAKAVGTGTFTINGGTIDNTSGAAITFSNNNVQTWGGDFTFVGSNALNLGTGAVTLGSNRIVTVSASTLTEAGIIAGAFSLTKAGAGALTLSGANTFSTGMTLSAGQLNINNGKAVGSGTFTINGGAVDNTSGGAIALTNNNAQTWGGDFTFVGSNALNLGTGAVTLSANRTVTVSANSLTVGGIIGDGGSNYQLIEAGSGTLTMTGASTFGGGVVLNAGTLLVENGAGSGTGSGAVTAGSGATLGGTGTISGAVTINSGGTLAPGAGGTSIFNTGNLTLASGSALDIALNGNTAGTGYDKVNVTGTVAVSGSILNLSGTRSAHDGSSLTIIDNGSAGAVTGTFQGLAEGASDIFNGVSYLASYQGGTGNDVTLSAQPASSTTVVASGTPSSVFGQSVTFTATVTSGSLGTPTGSITFDDGSTVLGTATLNGSGVATFSTSALGVGSHSISALYGGDTNFTSSTSSTLTQTVGQDATTSAVASSDSSAVFGESVTFTATITANAPGAGTPSGTATFMDGSTTLGTGTLNGSGIATFSTSALAVGSHSITVVYGGDTNFTTSTSSTRTQAVSQDTSTSVVASSANPSVSGQSVTFTATVTSNAPGSGTPTGTVTFLDGSTTLGTGTLNGSGVTTLGVSALAVGSHSITAVYGGDTNYSSSNSSALTQTVNQAATAVALSSSVEPSVFGESVTFAATVTASAPGSGTPTGSATFMDGATVLGTQALNGSGVASFATSGLAVGNHSITAVYGGDSNFTGITSSSSTQTVNQDASTASVSASVNPSVTGESVTFTATVTANSPGSGTPTGSVTFMDGATTLGTKTLGGSGSATFSTGALAVGGHSITVVYGGDTDFTAGSSSVLTQTVNQGSTSGVVASSANPSVFGQSVTFTATVTASAPSVGVPTGTVTFMDGSTSLGTGTLNGSGVATLSTSALVPGGHSITAVYAEDTNFAGSTSPAISQVVNQDATTSAVSSSVGPSAFGQSVTFTATVTANAPGSGTPSGTVTFKDGAATLGTGTLDGSGQATLSSSALSVGSHSITVVYGGDADFTSSTSSTLTQTVGQDSSTSAVASSTNPSVFGQSVTFTATVTSSAPGSGTPTGTVTFMDGSTTLGTGTLDGLGVTTFSTSALSIGSHSITAVYGGDTNFTTSTSSTLSQAVNQDSSSSVLASASNPWVFGQSVTFTATVTSNSPGAGTPTGIVTFMDGATTLGTNTLDGSGQATLSTSALSVGSHAIKVVYGGDTDFTSSMSSALNQTVGQDSSTSVVASSANPSVFGQSVTFTATVTSDAPGSGTPTGTVTFKDGSTTLGAGTLDGSGLATFSTAGLSLGSHSITVVYGGDTDFTGSTSSTLTQTVDQDSSTSVAASSANPSVFGQNVTFTATVVSNAPGSGTPTGSVTFKDGATVLGTTTLNGSGVATFSTSALGVASHSISALYGGDTNFTSSTSSTLTQTVSQDATTSAVASSDSSAVFGESVTFTATITANAPGAGTPTGTVVFKDGSTTLGTGTLNGSGIATFATSALAVAGHSITAVYGGDTNFTTSTSSTLTQTVSQDTSTSVVASSANPSVSGQSVTFTATVTSNAPGSGTPTGTVTFLDGSTTLGTGTLNGSGVATLGVSALAVGSQSITVVYSGDTDFTSSTSSALTQTVGQDSSTSVVASSANPSAFGQSVMFTATVTSDAPGSGTPTGTVTFKDGTTTLGTGTLDGSGQTTFSTAGLSVGNHSVTVVYGGNTNFTTSTSSSLTQRTIQSGTGSSVSSSANASVFGQSVTFTATVVSNAPGSGTPTGMVTFKDGSTTLGTGMLDGSGQATLSTSALSLGSHSITVVYGGDVDFTSSASSTLTQTVDQDSSTSVVASSANPSVFGQSVTFTATVTSDAPGSGTPTGTVTFVDGSTNLGTGTLDGSGQANFSTSALSVGDHVITVVYGGDSNFTTSTSAGVTQAVDQDSSSSVVASASNPSVFGQSVTFTATVTSNSPGAGTPTGTVTFMDGSTTLGSNILNGLGQATFSTAALAVGTHSITVVYGGDSNFTVSTSSPLPQTVNQDGAIATVSSSNEPSVFGQSVTFTATVTAGAPGSSTPTGLVTFLDGSTSLGTGRLNGSGVATFATSALSVGNHSITAVYGGDGNFATVTTSTLAQTVNQDSSTSVVAASANPSSFGLPVTFTATVTANSPGSGTPTGTVTFEDGATTLGTGTLNGSGVATLTTSALSVGNHSITVVYGGDTDYTGDTSSALTQRVDPYSSISVVATSANPTVFGQSVTYTATVTPGTMGSGTPTGTVVFIDGSTTLGTRTLDGSGQATFNTSALSVGGHPITVLYNGDTNFGSSTSLATTQVVDQDSTTAAVTASVNPSAFGQTITFTATVASNAPGSGTPTGTVAFMDGSTTLGTGTLNGAGLATFATSALSVGTHSITVVYGGDTDFTISTSSALIVMVNQDASTSVVAASANPSAFGQPVMFTATVASHAPGSGMPTGTVTFMDGATTLGTGTLNGSGQATLSTSALSIGSHSITIVYGGDADFTGSTSSIPTLTVGQDATTSSVAASNNPLAFGQLVTFTATVTSNAPGSGTPTGMVKFKDGSTTLGTGALNGSGQATFSTSGLSTGSHSVTVVYGGDTDFATSTSSALGQTVNRDSTATSVASSMGSSVFGQAITLTATVVANSPGSGTPAGTVTFKDGSTTLGTGTLNGSGVAILNAATLSAGSHSITAMYGGDANFTASTSSGITQVVSQDSTSSAVTASVNPSVFGQSVTFTATVISAPPGSGTPTGLVTFMDGSTNLGTGTLNGSGHATLSTSALPVGNWVITAVYGGDSNFTGSTSPTITQTVNQDASTSTVASSVNPSVLGQSVTFTSTVASNSPGSGTPTGTVVFMEGSTTLGTGTLNGAGQATFSTSTLSISAHSIHIVYGGDANFTNSASSTMTQTVNPFQASQLAFAPEPSNVLPGQTMTPALTVAIEDVNGNVVPSNHSTVTLSLGSGPAGSLGGTLTATAVNGIATFSNVTFSAIGTNTLTARDGSLSIATSSSFHVVPMVGSVDIAGMNVITGWASDPSDPAASINIQVVISGGPTQTMPANFGRPDLLPVIGSANHGFVYATPTLSTGNHTASIYAVLANGTKVLIGTRTLVSQNSLFDDHYYLEMNPDVAAAVADGRFATGYDHYIQYGQFEGRSPSPFWDEAYYLAQNPDVAAAVANKTVSSGFMHYYLYGQYQNRAGLLYFDNSYYLTGNPDVAAAVTAGKYTSGFEHFVLCGQYEGRSPMKFFSQAVYEAGNPDIVQFVTGQVVSSDYEHFVEFGQYEGRVASIYYNEQVYLASNPDVAAAVMAGMFKDGFQQWLEFGQYENRKAV
jgi:autotransporter-associated beta strand protein